MKFLFLVLVIIISAITGIAARNINSNNGPLVESNDFGKVFNIKTFLRPWPDDIPRVISMPYGDSFAKTEVKIASDNSKNERQQKAYDMEEIIAYKKSIEGNIGETVFNIKHNNTMMNNDNQLKVPNIESSSIQQLEEQLLSENEINEYETSTASNIQNEIFQTTAVKEINEGEPYFEKFSIEEFSHGDKEFINQQTDFFLNYFPEYNEIDGLDMIPFDLSNDIRVNYELAEMNATLNPDAENIQTETLIFKKYQPIKK